MTVRLIKVWTTFHCPNCKREAKEITDKNPANLANPLQSVVCITSETPTTAPLDSLKKEV